MPGHTPYRLRSYQAGGSRDGFALPRRRRAAAPGRPAGAQVARPRREGPLFRHVELEIRGMDWLDLQRVALSHAWQALEEEVRRPLPLRVCPDVPDGLRRLRLLPIPLRRILGPPVRSDA